MKKNLLTVLILALLVVNVVLTGVLTYSVMSTNKKTSELVTNIAAVLNLELSTPGDGNDADEVPLSNLVIWSIEQDMMIPLTSVDGENHYIVFKVSFSMDSKSKGYKKYGEGIANYESIIKDAIHSTVSTHTIEECRNDFEGMRKEILKSVQNLFDLDFIYKVAISDVKFQ